MQKSQAMEDQILSAVTAFAHSIDSGGRVVGDLFAVIDATSELPLTNLNYWERLIRDAFSSALKSTPQPTWMFGQKRTRFLTWLDLISWNGYTREKTLRSISGPAPNAFFFSLAIRRLNDWVPEVREAARDNLFLMAQETALQHVVDALCHALSHWNSWGRIQKSDKQALLDIISSREMAEPLKSKLISSATGPMPLLFTQIGRTPVLDAHLGEISQNAVQPAVRAKAYRFQFERKMAWVEGRKWEWTDIRYCKGKWKPVVVERRLERTASFLEVLKNSAVDRSSMVRRVAAEFLIRELESLGDQAMHFAEHFAADSSGAVAEKGRFALKMLDETHARVQGEEQSFDSA